MSSVLLERISRVLAIDGRTVMNRPARTRTPGGVGRAG